MKIPNWKFYRCIRAVMRDIAPAPGRLEALSADPGSIGQPRDTDPRAGFAIADLEITPWNSGAFLTILPRAETHARRKIAGASGVAVAGRPLIFIRAEALAREETSCRKYCKSAGPGTKQAAAADILLGTLVVVAIALSFWFAFKTPSGGSSRGVLPLFPSP